MVSAARMCLICKGSRRLCGWRSCPLYRMQQTMPALQTKLKKEFFGPSTSVFVGHNFYPNVYAGPLAPVETEPGALSDTLKIIDSPQKWFGLPYGDIISMRSTVLRSKQRENIFSKSRFVEGMQELALSGRPTDVEMGFRKRPSVGFDYSDFYQPMGPSATIERFRLAGNAKIPAMVEKVVTDDLKAADAGFMLYSRGVDVNKITAVLASGALGAAERRKLVPTRWSITATDTMLADRLLSDVKNCREIGEHMVFESEYLGNRFLIMLMPGPWEFENFEAWAPGSTWSMGLKKTEILGEYEPYGGRKSYASLQAGGFYAARFSVIRALKRMRRQATVVSFREVSEGYMIPLGVWVVRSTAMDAMEKRPRKFGSREEALKYAGSRLRVPLREYLSRSRILGRRTVSDFLGSHIESQRVIGFNG